MSRTEILKIGGLLVIFGLAPILTSAVIAQNQQNVHESTENNSVMLNKISQENAQFPSTPEVASSEPILQPAPQQTNPQVESAQTSTPAPQPKKPVPAPITVQTEPSQITSASCSGNLTQKFVCLLNNYRTDKGLSKISLNSSLSQVALGHSIWMNETGIFSHTGENGSRLTERCAAAGVRCLAENLAEGIYTAEELLSSWSANPSHNKNLLGPYTTMGIAMSGDYVTLLLN